MFRVGVLLVVLASISQARAVQLDAATILERQPDFEASLVVESAGRRATVGRIARKGTRIRFDAAREGSSHGPVFLRDAAGQAFILSPVTKTYERREQGPYSIPIGVPWLFFGEAVEFEGKRLRADGTEMVDGHPCLKLIREGKRGAYYAATDLRGLVIKIDNAGGKGEWGAGLDTYFLTDISLTPVPDALFRVPEGYSEADDLLFDFAEPELELAVGEPSDETYTRHSITRPAPFGKEVRVEVKAFGYYEIIDNLTVSGVVRPTGTGKDGSAALAFRYREQPDGNGASYIASFLADAEGEYEVAVSVAGRNPSGYTFKRELTERFLVARPKPLER